MKTIPAVFAVADEYQIIVNTRENVFVWVEVNGKKYYDESNGIMRSWSKAHRVNVPMEELDKAEKYIVFTEKIIERKPYFSVMGEVESESFGFRPVPKKGARAFHIADAHNDSERPVMAAKAAGEIDFLILNGDIPNDSGDVENFSTVYEIAAQITGGNIPIVFARGNHDMRGIYAEKFADYTPSHNGKTYYTFRLGSIWGIALDCGEDKDDSHEEYGGTVCCHTFRERETAFLEKVISDAEKEYLSEGVETRIVVVHNPFTRKYQPPFDIEEDIYTKWAKLLKENIKPDVMICGHVHKISVDRPGGDRDGFGQPCTVVCATHKSKDRYEGTLFTFGESEIKAEFYSDSGEKTGEAVI